MISAHCGLIWVAVKFASYYNMVLTQQKWIKDMVSPNKREDSLKIVGIYKPGKVSKC